jgi:hypothetical protein
MKGRATPRLRLASFLAAGSMIVHELRYVTADGADAHAVEAHQGHAYLGLATPAVALLLAAVLSWVMVRAAVNGQARGRAVRVRRSWLVLGLALLSIYVAQELVEGVLSTGHPDGLEGVFGGGGLFAVPLSLIVGALMALALRATEALERVAASAGRLSLPKRLRPLSPISLSSVSLRARPASRTRNLRARGPPAAV